MQPSIRCHACTSQCRAICGCRHIQPHLRHHVHRLPQRVPAVGAGGLHQRVQVRTSHARMRAAQHGALSHAHPFSRHHHHETSAALVFACRFYLDRPAHSMTHTTEHVDEPTPAPAPVPVTPPSGNKSKYAAAVSVSLSTSSPAAAAIARRRRPSASKSAQAK